MAEHVLDVPEVTEPPIDGHVDARDVAAYVDGTATPAVRALVDAHLVTCAACRDEVMDVSRIAAFAPRERVPRRIWIGAAAAAVLLVVLLRPSTTPDERLTHRDAPVTTTVAPVAIAPAGLVDAAPGFVWSSVPHADRYHIRLFDAAGSVLWERETADTVAMADSIRVVPGRAYYWKVDAHAGFNRSTTTELIEFSVRDRR